jgi:hypothetical protein
MAAQIFTLIGVVIGALASYLVGSLNERARLRRGECMERLTLIADADTLLAARMLNRASWQLQGFATGVITDVEHSAWEDAIRTYNEALNSFHDSARREMQVPGEHPARALEPSPRADVFHLLGQAKDALHRKDPEPGTGQ